MPRKRLRWDKFKDVKVSFTNYNSKARKGRYVVVTDGEKRSIYKYKSKDLGSYYKAFKGGLKSKKLGVSDAQVYSKKIRSVPNLESVIKPGISSTILRDLRLMTNRDVDKSYRELMRERVNDKQLLKLITSRENVKKMKIRLEHDIEFMNQEGVVMTRVKAFNMDLDEVAGCVNKETKGGFFNKGGLLRLKDKGFIIDIISTNTKMLYNAANSVIVRDKVTFVKRK